MVTVEVDLSLGRPPRVDCQVWVEIAVLPEWSRDLSEAEELACQVAMSSRKEVVMAVGARIIDWS